MSDPRAIAEMRVLAHSIGHALADDSLGLSVVEHTNEPGTEPSVVFCINGTPVFEFRRDDFLDSLYEAACKAIDQGEPEKGPVLQ